MRLNERCGAVETRARLGGEAKPRSRGSYAYLAQDAVLNFNTIQQRITFPGSDFDVHFVQCACENVEIRSWLIKWASFGSIRHDVAPCRDITNQFTFQESIPKIVPSNLLHMQPNFSNSVSSNWCQSIRFFGSFDIAVILKNIDSLSSHELEHTWYRRSQLQLTCS